MKILIVIMPALRRHDLQQMVREHAAKCKDEGVDYYRSWKVAGTMQDTKFTQAVIWDQSMGLSLLCFLKNVQMIGECCQTGLRIGD
ncbi:unnamed protein product [Ilex paraguariensis]|uniref:Uncharacterized protein n=1 Tax=Ilex paraguariensis TaxID=185542 RepID=A0ABC8R7A7_9AQUA